MKKNFLFILLCLGVNVYSLNILVLTWGFPAPFHKFIWEDVTSFIDRGHNVKILIKNKINKQNNDYVGAEIAKYDLGNCVYSEHNINKLDFFKKNYFDIIYSAFGRFADDAIEIKNRFCQNAKVIVAYQGFDITKLLDSDPNNYKKVFNDVDLFLPVSIYFKNLLIEAGCDEKKIKLYYTGVNEKLLMPKVSWNCGYPLFVSVGRLAEEKGFEHSIKAFAKILTEYPKIKYCIIGEGSLRQELQMLINKLELQEHVFLLGAKSYDEVAELLNQSDIFIMPSIIGPLGQTEGIPNALKEAMFTKLPCIGTRHPGIPELIKDNVTGLLVDERNIDQLAKAMDKLLQDQNLRERLGCAGYEHVYKSFRRETQDDFLDQTFRELVNDTF